MCTTCQNNFRKNKLEKSFADGESDLEQVELNPALHVYGFVLSAAHLLALEVQVTQDWFAIQYPTKVGKSFHL